MSTEQINPWETRTSLPRLSTVKLLPLYLAVLLSALQLVLFEVPAMSYILLPALFLYIAVTVRAPSVTLLILGTVVLSSILTFSVTAAAILLALIVGAGTLAVLLSAHRPIAPALAILAAVFVFAWVLTGDWQIALLAFASLPAALFLALATTGDRGRTSIICWGTAGFLLSLAIFLCFVLYRIYGEFNREILFRAFEDAQNGIRYSVAALRDQLISTLQATDPEASAELIKTLNAYLSNDVIKAYTSLFFSLIPAMAAMLCSILAFQAQLLQGLSYRAIGWGQVLTRSACTFTMSVISAILYYISFIATLFFGSGSIVIAVLNNICLMLLPGFCVLGATSLIYRLRTSRGNGRVLLILLCAGILCFSGILSLFFLALWGANTAITLALNRKIAEKLNNRNGSDNDHRE